MGRGGGVKSRAAVSGHSGTDVLVTIACVPAIAVTFVKIDPRPTAVIGQTTTWEDFPSVWGKLLDEVYRFVRTRTHLATGDGAELWQNVMLYKDDRPDVEVGVLVSESFKPEGRVTASELPGGEVARANHRGDYARLGVTHDAVRDQVAAHGRELAGPRWEIYGHWREDPSEMETEVFWLLR
jgi:effector-binding domain-containing protein